MTSNVSIFFIVALIAFQVQPFVINSFNFNTKRSGILNGLDYQRQKVNVLLSTPSPDDTQKSSSNEGGEGGSMSFDNAAQALRDKEDQERLERTGNAVTEEQSAKFEAKKSEYEALRDRIRNRASELDISKSVTTQEIIQKANEQALSGEKPLLDLSRFDDDDDEEELTEEEKKEIDQVGELNILQQCIEEFKLVKWPSFGSTLRLTGIMLVLFVLTAFYILWLDNAIRTLVTNAGFIPRPDDVLDFSDLELPDGWTEFMTDEDTMGM